MVAVRRTRLTSRRLLVLVLVALVAALPLGHVAAIPRTTVITFDQFTGPPIYGTADPRFTIGPATFAGGELLTNTTGLLADETTVYGTSNFCRGCPPTLTITFSQRVRDFSMMVFNGEPFSVTYTVVDNHGHARIKTLPSFTSLGATTMRLFDTGITNVQLYGRSTTTWDFLIDTVKFNTP